MRSLRKTDPSAKPLSATIWDGILQFVFKIAIPLIPILAIVLVAGMIMNMEVTGLYQGVTPGIGAISLDLVEDNDQLSGSLILRNKQRYTIISGKMLDDTRMQIELKPRSADDVSAVNLTNNPKRVGKTELSQSKPIPESMVPDGLSDIPPAINPKVEVVEQLIEIEASKDQNTLSGTLERGGQKTQIRATRNSFSSFFGKRYITRTLRYFGIKWS